ncbi:MAG: TonB-dependent receptor [Schwartzia sp.]|nr:TonB-dependent receptor [Schwartzia sp. (in: firmicutes)]
MKAYRKLGRKSLRARNALLAGLLVLGGGTFLPLTAEAAEAEEASETAQAETAAEAPTYTMGEMVVTATRTEKREIDVPMATEVITEEDIKDSGATNMAEILQKVHGFTWNTMGPLGASNGVMANDVVVRGVDNGTLVLMNGVSISQRGLYNLQEIPADIIEQVEVVKGGGGTLYGSAAMGGVINIITKSEAANSVTVGFGNFAQSKYHLNVGGDGLVVTYDRNWFGHVEDMTSAEVTRGMTTTDFRDTRNQSATVSYKFNDHLNFMYGHYDTRTKFLREVSEKYATASATAAAVGAPFNDIENITSRDTVQLNYHDRNWKASLFYNSGMIEKRTHTYLNSSLEAAPDWADTQEKNITYGLDVQRNWTIGKGTLTAGFFGERESFQQLYTDSNGTYSNFMRNNWAVFAQWDQKIDKKNSFIIGARETWASASESYSNFSASGQFLHKMTKNDSLFLNISQSFIMPTLKQIYGSTNGQTATPGLKPQKGINYEIGWKRMKGDHTWKASLFRMDIKDNISATLDPTTASYVYGNEDFQNEGLELSYALQKKEGFSYNLGLTWQNPKVKDSGRIISVMGRRVSDYTKPYWDRTLGKFQLTGGISYKKDKWRAAFNWSLLTARVRKVNAAPNIHEKPYFLTTLTVAYAPTDKSEFALTVDNVFDRRDVVSKGTSPYYSAPCNFLFSFTQKF